MIWVCLQKERSAPFENSFMTKTEREKKKRQTKNEFGKIQLKRHLKLKLCDIIALDSEK